MTPAAKTRLFTQFRHALAAFVMACLWTTSTALPCLAFDTGRVGFEIEIQGLRSDLALLTSVTRPGGSLQIRTKANATFDEYAAADTQTGRLVATQDGWDWIAPQQPGLTRIRFEHDGDFIVLNAFVGTPFSNGRQTELRGFRIGRYSPSPFRGLKSYLPPLGFIELTPALENFAVSPHFRLGQFRCKQQPGRYPAYVLVRPALLVKLERLLEEANATGWKAETLHVMSGFRTPHYNAAIGNTTTSSRHLFGDAADVFIDADDDGTMDDLNGDGKINTDDAKALAALAESLATTLTSRWPAGGLAAYSATPAHGPFVHLDARGYRARWGK